MGPNATLKQTVKLLNGKTIPAVGLGTWRLQPTDVAPIVERAIELGCRHIDCAAIYENEEFVGRAIAGVLDKHDRFHVERKDVPFVPSPELAWTNLPRNWMHSCSLYPNCGTLCTPVMTSSRRVKRLSR